ncbi:MAG: protein-tyrosine phosphatase family protein [Anaerolineae bacterium]
MRYVYWIIDRLLAGRPGPGLRPWDPAALYAGGIRVVISLPAEEAIGDLTPYGLVHYRAEFPPVKLYSVGMRKAFIYQALPVWAFIHEQMEADRPTLVHCYAGQDRTGAILAGYLITYQGKSPEQALQQVRSVKPMAMTAEGYADVLTLLEPDTIPDPKTLL